MTRLPYLICTQGVPGSGKSTWAIDTAEKHSRGRIKTVCLDDLRLTLDRANNHTAPKDAEHLVLDTQSFIVREAINRGHDVIVHNTHGSARIPNRLRRENAGTCTPILVPFDTPLDEAVRRDANRDDTVGPDVIARLAKVRERNARAFNTWRKETPDGMAALLAEGKAAPAPHGVPPGTPTPSGNRKAVIVDLDGTLAIHNGRNPYDGARCQEDIINWAVYDAACGIVPPSNIIFLSGRDSKWRHETEQWLATVDDEFEPDQLFMRAEGDGRPDAIVKKELYLKHVHQHFDVQVVFDDRNVVVDMWRRLGLTCFQVAPGNF